MSIFNHFLGSFSASNSRKISVLALLAAFAVFLPGCDNQRIAQLEDAASTEGAVRIKSGEPEKIWDGADGSKIFEYNRQPAGTQNYMITIGTDGKMSALRQVLTPQNFAKITPGMMMEDVRKMLGKPMKITPYELVNEYHYQWRFLDGANESDKKIFTVVFNTDLKVKSTSSAMDPSLSPNGPN
mgnify:FL=1